ncbi:MAG: hypothetical protein HOB82_05710 [Alphaproteobacteria bacterium]|nr:hypothetical protein [Alphaproteobacteria bacterium]
MKINASRMDAEFDGIATGLSTAITKDGQTTITADLPMATNKHTGVGNAAARTDYAAAGQVQDASLVAVAGGGAADVQTLTPSPSITAYADYQRFWFLPVADNTGACTLNVSAVGAKDIKISDGAGTLTDPAAGDLDTAIIADVIYDGTQFILQNPATFAAGGVQSLDADLTAIAGLAHTSGKAVVSDGSAWTADYPTGFYPNAARNPSMRWSQRGTSHPGMAPTSTPMTLDGWKWSYWDGAQTVVETVSQESNGGVDGNSKWMKRLVTTGTASPEAICAYTMYLYHEGNHLQPLIDPTTGFIGETMIGADVFVHLGAGSGLSAPFTLSWSIQCLDLGTQKSYTGGVTVTAEDTWERVYLSIPSEAAGQMDNDTGHAASLVWTIGGNTSKDIDAGWRTQDQNFMVTGFSDFGDAADNYVGLTNVDWYRGTNERPFVAPSYETDEKEAYRYYRRFETGTSMRLARGHSNTTTAALCLIPHMVEMREPPVLAVSGVTDFDIQRAAASSAVTNLVMNKASVWNSELNATTGATQVAGQGVELLFDAGGTRFLALDADLD